MDKLTPKQKLFCDAYLANGFNGVQACREAGYRGADGTLRVIACENLTKPNIKTYIDKSKAEQAEKLNITREDLVKRHLKVLAYIDELIEKKECDAPYFGNYNKTMDSLARMLGLNEPEKVELSGELKTSLVVDFGEH